jgi:glycosyltransferase involved in cell wall biosynthesis
MSEQPFLSIILPTYNGVAYLEQALAGVAAELTPEIPVELIAIDDGSTDGTPEMLRAWSSRMPLRSQVLPHSGNWVASTNVGLTKARGRYVCFLHQDDLWLPGRLAALRSGSARHPMATLFLSPSRFIDSRGQPCGLWRCPLTPGQELTARDVLPHLAVQNFIAIPAPVFARSAVQAVGALDETLWFTADWDYWARLAEQGTTVYQAVPQTAFRIHSLSQTAQGSRNSDDFRSQYQAAIERTLRRAEAVGCGDLVEVRCAAQWSCEMNVALAALAHRRSVAWQKFFRAMPASPRVWRRFFHSARFWDRTLARLRA